MSGTAVQYSYYAVVYLATGYFALSGLRTRRWYRCGIALILFACAVYGSFILEQGADGVAVIAPAALILGLICLGRYWAFRKRQAFWWGMAFLLLGLLSLMAI